LEIQNLETNIYNHVLVLLSFLDVSTILVMEIAGPIFNFVTSITFFKQCCLTQTMFYDLLSNSVATTIPLSTFQ